jgi:hypothetical protein
VSYNSKSYLYSLHLAINFLGQSSVSHFYLLILREYYSSFQHDSYSGIYYDNLV